MTPKERGKLKEALLTAERVRELLSYDAGTGVFVWRVRRAQHVAAGAIAGNPRLDGYLQIMIDKVNYTAHRLAVLWMTGAWPPDMVDHIDGKKSNNQWNNLRPSNPSHNQQNRRVAETRNKHGLMGIVQHTNGKGFCAVIEVRGVQRYCGYFQTPKEAHAAYLAAKIRLHEGYVRTGVKS